MLPLHGLLLRGPLLHPLLLPLLLLLLLYLLHHASVQFPLEMLLLIDVVASFLHHYY